MLDKEIRERGRDSVKDEGQNVRESWAGNNEQE